MIIFYDLLLTIDVFKVLRNMYGGMYDNLKGEKIKFSEECMVLKKGISIACTIMVIFYMYYFFDLVKSYSISIY